jgi:hypothetical protein
MVQRKTDNVALPSKVAIRCWLLARMGFTDDVRVLDTCAGSGKVWSAMEDHVTIRQWTRCDIHPRWPFRDTLPMSAVQAIAKFPLHVYNVIDIDPYGEPWEAYRALLPRLTTTTAVFLTEGHVMYGGASNASKDAIGIPTDWPIPPTQTLSQYVAAHALGRTLEFATVRVAGQIVLPGVTYYALGLDPLPR